MMEIERSIPHVLLDHSQLLALARQAFPLCQQLDGWKMLSGGALNTTYQIQIQSGIYVLRVYARHRAYCKTEKVLHQLIEKSVPIAKLIYANDSHEPWAFSIFDFVEGIHISDVSNTDKTSLSHELGNVLASIHAFKFPRAGLFGDGIAIGYPFELNSSPYFEETYSILSSSKHVRERLGEQLTYDALAFIQKNKDLFPKVKNNNICLTHSDFKPVNLLYKKDKKVCVLDWEFAHAGINILDFAILLRHRHQFPLDISALESSYLNSGGILPSEWQRTALITDFVNLVQLMDSPSERPQLFQHLKHTLQTTMQLLEARNFSFLE